MSILLLSFLGSPSFELDAAPIGVKRRKVLAHLAYLAVTEQRHGRETLAELLFPGQERSIVNGEFRRTLSLLRSVLGNEWIEVDRASVWLPATTGLLVDVREFRRLVAEGRRRQDDLDGIAALLEHAEGLYRGEFLQGFYLKDSATFDEWQEEEADSLRRDLEAWRAHAHAFHAT